MTPVSIGSKNDLFLLSEVLRELSQERGRVTCHLVDHQATSVCTNHAMGDQEAIRLAAIAALSSLGFIDHLWWLGGSL